MKNVFEEDAAAEQPQEQLAAVSAVVQEALDAESAIAVAEENLKAAKARHLRLTTEVLPTLFMQLNLKELRTADGAKVKINPEYHASIPKSKSSQAMEWLRKNGHPNIIRSSVSVDVPAADESVLKKVAAFCDKAKLDYNAIETVHPQTLKAFVKEQHESGTPVPKELFGVFIIDRATITRSKTHGK